MSLVQRYTRATLSSNLRNDELHVTPDVLAAMALSSNFGGLLARAKYGLDAGSFRRLLDKWTWIVSTKAVRRNWPLHIPIDKVAYLSLRRWINSACPVCEGTGHTKVPGAPARSDRDCKACRGSGRTELRCNVAIRDYVLDMVEELESDLLCSAARARKKLRSDSEDAAAKLA
jgi:hypothetical protein